MAGRAAGDCGDPRRFAKGLGPPAPEKPQALESADRYPAGVAMLNGRRPCCRNMNHGEQRARQRMVWTMGEGAVPDLKSKHAFY